MTERIHKHAINEKKEIKCCGRKNIKTNINVMTTALAT